MDTARGLGLKPPTTYQEQIDILKRRGLIIPDEGFAAEVLSNVNYYRFSAYLLPFRVSKTEDYLPGTSFGRVWRIYDFDRRLRNTLMSALEPIEVSLRTRLAYFHAHKYGAAGYENPGTFLDHQRHEDFMNEFHDAVERNRKAVFVKHHIENYAGHFPIWVAVEVFSFGMLSKFYSNLKPDDRRQIAKDLGCGPDHLKSWLVCLAYVRNSCAHYARLYYQQLTALPRLPRGRYMNGNNKVFDAIYVMKFLYPDLTKWKSSFVQPLHALVDECQEDINLSDIGFPVDWLQLLKEVTK